MLFSKQASLKHQCLPTDVHILHKPEDIAEIRHFEASFSGASRRLVHKNMQANKENTTPYISILIDQLQPNLAGFYKSYREVTDTSAVCNYFQIQFQAEIASSKSSSDNLGNITLLKFWISTCSYTPEKRLELVAELKKYREALYPLFTVSTVYKEVLNNGESQVESTNQIASDDPQELFTPKDKARVEIFETLFVGEELFFKGLPAGRF